MAANRKKRFLVALWNRLRVPNLVPTSPRQPWQSILLDLMRGTEGVLNGLLGEYPGTFRHYADALALYDR